jgi:membrane-associated protein
MSSLTDWLLTGVINYGAPVLALAVYIGSLGIPFPITLVVVAAGAFARQGLLDWRLELVIGVSAAVLADTSIFAIGYWGEKKIKKRFGQSQAWTRAQDIFERQGNWAILLTRFWLTPLATPVNLIAGSRITYYRFLMVDAIGELIWVVLYGGTGYLFGGQWEVVSQFITDFSGFSVGLVVLAAGIYFWRRRGRRNKEKL